MVGVVSRSSSMMTGSLGAFEICLAKGDSPEGEVPGDKVVLRLRKEGLRSVNDLRLSFVPLLEAAPFPDVLGRRALGRGVLSSESVNFGPPSCHISTTLGISIRLTSLSHPMSIVATRIRRMTKVHSLGSLNVERGRMAEEWK